MHAKIHREMTFRVLQDHKNPKLLEFLIEGSAKPEWKKKKREKEEWLKEWMDMPDNKNHCSKMSNDHSYKIEKNGDKFRIKFIGNKADLATVIARLKYDSRDVKEWAVEEEPRTCAIELAKSIHWVVDFSTPPHTAAAWDDAQHSRVEKDFDKLWEKYYDKTKVKFGRKAYIKDIYRWAKDFVEAKYERNHKLYEIYKDKGSISKGIGAKIGQEVILDLAQNLADYFAYFDKKIDFGKMLKALKK